MMLKPLPLLGATLAVGLTGPVLAQTPSAKDAWEAMHTFFDGAGLQLRSSGLTRDGAALVARDVVLSSTDTPPSFALTFPEMRLDPQDSSVAIQPSPDFGMTVRGSDESVRSYGFAHDGGMTFTLTEQALTLALGFPSLTVEQTGATRSGRTLDEGLSATLADLVGQFTVALTSPIGLEGSLSVAQLDYGLRMSETEFVTIRQDATSSTRDLSLTLSMAGLDQFADGAEVTLAQAFANGFAASAEMLSGATTSTTDQTLGNTRFALNLTADASRLGVSLADGRFAFDTGVTGIAVQGESQGIPGAGTIAEFVVDMGAPVVVLPQDDEFHMRLAITDLALDRALLDLIGAGAFGEDTVTFDATVTGLGRWLVEITEDPAPSQMPIVMTSVSLPQFLARLGSSMLTGNGSFAFTPGTFGQGDVPDGTGDFVFELTGGELALNRLSAAGLLPPDQQFMTRMLMNAFGRATGPDVLRSEIAIRPGNQITVNGAPLPF